MVLIHPIILLITPFLLQFRKNTEHSNFSSSVVDVFTQLTQCFEVLQKLECEKHAIWNRYMKRFAKTVIKVLMAYADLLKADFPSCLKDERMVSDWGTAHEFRKLLIAFHIALIIPPFASPL